MPSSRLASGPFLNATTSLFYMRDGALDRSAKIRGRVMHMHFGNGIQPYDTLTEHVSSIIDLNRRWHFIITLNLSDRRHSNSDHAAPAQFYRGNLPHWHGWRVPAVAAVTLHRGSLQRRASLKTPAVNRGRNGRSPFPSARRKARRELEFGQAWGSSSNGAKIYSKDPVFGLLGVKKIAGASERIGNGCRPALKS